MVNLVAVKMLSTFEYGIISIYITIATSIATLSAIGLGTTCNKMATINRDSDPELVRIFGFISIVIASFLAFFISVFYWPFLQDSYLKTFGELMAFVSILSVAWIISVGGIFEGLLFGTRNYVQLFKNSTISILISIPIIIYSTNKFGLIGCIVAIIISRLLIIIINFLTLSREGWLITKESFVFTRLNEIKIILLKTSLPLALSGIVSGPAIAMALLLVVNSHGPSEAAIYALPYQIYLIATFIPGSLGHFFTSRYGQESNTSKSIKLLYITIFNIGMAGAGFATMMLFKVQILSIANFDLYNKVEETYFLFAFCTLFYSLNNGFISYWISSDKAWIHLVSQISWCITMVASVYLNHKSDGASSIPLGFIYGYIIQIIINFLAFIVEKVQENFSSIKY